MIIEYSLATAEFDTVNNNVTHVWQYSIPHNPKILGTFTGTEQQLLDYLVQEYRD